MFAISSMSDGVEIFIPKIEKETDHILKIVTKALYNINYEIKSSNDAIKASYYIKPIIQAYVMLNIYAIFSVASLVFITNCEANIIEKILLLVFPIIYGISIKIAQKDIKNEKQKVHAANRFLIQTIQMLEIKKLELESKFKDFRSLIVAMQGKNDDVTALLGKKYFDLS